MIVKGFEQEGVIKVDNVRVYGLDESIIASGYPMQVNTYDMEEIAVDMIAEKRAKHLGNAVAGSGHDCFLKGITLQFDLQVSEYIWRQLDRYHFIDYISSQSKMHRILKMDIDKACNKYVARETIYRLKDLIYIYNNYDEFISFLETEGNEERRWEEYERFRISNDNRLVWKGDLVAGNCEELAKEKLFKMIIANTPSGIMLTARMTTNYLQLKSIINQRSSHKMEEWRLLCDYFKTLPLVNEIVVNK